ncbi:MAG: energy transducer TonB [Erythrobacter sp.]|nr:energy transducer TonB [Erythrobacter sp.]
MDRVMYVLAAISASVSSPAAASDIVGEYGGWTVFESDDSCGLMMEFEGPGSTLFTLFKSVDGEISAMISNLEWSAQEGQKYEVTYSLNGKSYSGAVIGTRISGRGGFLGKFSEKFGTDFAQGTTLHVYLGKQRIDQLSLDGTSVAIAAVNRCLPRVRAKIDAEAGEEARYEHLPRDPFASSPALAPNQEVRPIRHQAWIQRVGQYPRLAERDGIEGSVTVLVQVASDGTVTNCEVKESSGSAELDQAACNGIARYAKFAPATNSEGEPIPGEYSTTIVYSLT